MWASFAGVVFAAVLLWAVRNHQFSDFNRQRFLALDVNETKSGQAPGTRFKRLNTAALMMMIISWLGAIIYTLWVAFTKG
jgi:nitrogen fixation-related uncharacterized protein